MSRRRWTGAEVWVLLDLATKVSQAEAAMVLNRTRQSVDSKTAQMGFRWRDGVVSLLQIAKRVGCSQTTVKNFMQRRRHKAIGQLTGKRYLLDYDEAQQVIAELKAQLERNAQQRDAGRARGVTASTTRDDFS
jgi:hypothetical protein